MVAGPLRRGERGEDVELLQRRLNRAGYPVLVDGVFGPRSQAAVAAFLAEQHLPGDGATVDEPELTRLAEVTTSPLQGPPAAAAPRVSTRAPSASCALPPQDVYGEDERGTEVETEAFARVICSTRAKAPLSIGLFGDWGTGKSYFMSRLQRRIDERGQALQQQQERLARNDDGEADEAERAERAEQAAALTARWHSRVAQMSFNAWHFAEPNLWASLVTRIFDQLAGVLNPDEAVEDTRTRLLAEVSEGKQRREQAALELRQAEGVLSEAKAQAEQRELELEALREQLAVIEAAAPVTGDDQDSPPRSVLRVKGPVAALRVSWRWLWSRGKWTRRAVVAGIVLLVLGLGLALLAWAELVDLDPTIALGTACIGVVTGLGGTAAAYWAVVAPALVKARAAYTLATKGHAATRSFLDRAARELLKPGTSALAVARRRLADAEAGASSAQAASEAAAEQVTRAQQMLQDLAAGQRFYAFIRDRSRSDDYRKHLGLVSAIRADFEQLGEILRQVEREGPGPDAPEPITRIVLYIDDLDRCEPARVVEVLQAVHMLLSTPIFVVVLAVDVRWLRQSLSLHFEHLLGPADATRDLVDDDRPTPRQYLEKVFQVPFTLRPIGARGFAALVDQALERETLGPSDEPDAPAPPAADSMVRELSTDVVLELQRAEVAFLKTLRGVIVTPRLAQALINSYRVLRAEIPRERLGEYLGSGTFRGVLTLLAIGVGRSVQAPPLFRALLTSERPTLGEVTDELAAASSAPPVRERWQELGHTLARAGAETIPVADLRPWLVQVQRFSFNPWPPPPRSLSSRPSS